MKSVFLQSWCTRSVTSMHSLMVFLSHALWNFEQLDNLLVSFPLTTTIRFVYIIIVYLTWVGLIEKTDS